MPLMPQLQGNIKDEEMCVPDCYTNIANNEQKPLQFVSKDHQGNMCNNYMPSIISTTQQIPLTFVNPNNAFNNSTNKFAPASNIDNTVHSSKGVNVNTRLDESNIISNVYNPINTVSNNEWQQFMLQKQ